jgi:hypothetical protein
VSAALEKFARCLISSAWLGEDRDGGDIQELALELGLIEEVPGGFDPAAHEDYTGCAEPGCTWYAYSGPLAEGGEE